MKVVVSTGCPHSGWEEVLAVLNQMGLESAGNYFIQCLDELLPAKEFPELDKITEDVQPNIAMIERIMQGIHNHSGNALLFADSRNLQLLNFWADKFPNATFLLFYTCSEAAAAHVISKSLDLRQFLNIWEKVNYKLLRFKRRYRQRTLLFDSHSVIQNANLMIPICARFGIELQSQKNTALPFAPSQLEWLLAKYWVESEKHLQQLQAELEASAFPLGESSENLQPQPIELLRDFRRLQEKKLSLNQALIDTENELHASRYSLHIQKEKNFELQNTVKERDLALENFLKELEVNQYKLDQLQGSLDKKCAEIKNLNDQHKAQLEEAQQSCLRVEADYEKAINEKKLLLQQIHKVQEELETVFLHKHRLDEEHKHIKKLEATLKIKEKELGEKAGFLILIRESILWRITAPLRMILRPFIIGNKARIRTQEILVNDSGLFNESWYLTQYPEAQKNGMTPIEHYIRYGAAKGYDPSPEFGTRYYLDANPDVADAGLNPLVHYIQYGRAEGRNSKT